MLLRLLRGALWTSAFCAAFLFVVFEALRFDLFFFGISAKHGFVASLALLGGALLFLGFGHAMGRIIEWRENIVVDKLKASVVESNVDRDDPSRRDGHLRLL